jgi:hypothetical protein
MSCLIENIPPTSGCCNLFAFSSFYSIFSATDVAKGGLHLLLGGLHLLFGQHNQWGPPARTASKPYLKCWDTSLPTLNGVLCSFPLPSQVCVLSTHPWTSAILCYFLYILFGRCYCWIAMVYAVVPIISTRRISGHCSMCGLSKLRWQHGANGALSTQFPQKLRITCIVGAYPHVSSFQMHGNEWFVKFPKIERKTNKQI